MHRSKVNLIITLLLFLNVWSCGSESPNETHVFITNTGVLYHTEECSYLSKSKIPVPLLEAWNKGYNPCQKCYPLSPRHDDYPNAAQPVLKDDAAVDRSDSQSDAELKKVSEKTSRRCSGITRKGIQCKRLTRNGNGRCYQHQP